MYSTVSVRIGISCCAQYYVSKDRGGGGSGGGPGQDDDHYRETIGITRMAGSASVSLD